MKSRGRCRSVDTGVIFYPRGGSAQVVRYLLPMLERRFATSTRLFVGSLGDAAAPSNAHSFYGAIDLYPVDYTDAVNAADHGLDPMAHATPLPPSYEDRPGAPDRVFCGVSPALAENITRSWTEHMNKHNVAKTDVVHLHHLTPLHGALNAIRRGGATVTTLHGTELKMLENASMRVGLAAKLGLPVAAVAERLRSGATSVDGLADGHGLIEQELTLLGDGRWDQWVHAEFWIEALRRYADLTTRLVVISDHDRSEATRLLGKDDAALHLVPDGVDVDHFVAESLTDAQRFALLRHWLVEQPRGWRPGAGPGSVNYSDADLARLWRPDGRLRPIFLFVGRFLGFKRLPLLVRAFAEARTRTDADPALVVWGGYPDEWEGEHPYDVAVEAGVAGHVYFIGWRGHDELPAGLSCADVMAAPALNESFGLVYLEAMSCRRPVIASASGGPLKFVVSEGEHANGWLVDDADRDGLVSALAMAAADAPERRRRGDNAARMVRERYSWSSVAETYHDIYDDAFSEARSQREPT